MLGRIKTAIRTHIDECKGIIHMKNFMFLNMSRNGDITTLDHRGININIVNNNVQINRLPQKLEYFVARRGT